jgi:hypothetical protein
MGRSYTIVFIEPVDLTVLATAGAEAFAIPRERIEVWDGDAFTTLATAKPVIAQVATGSGPGTFAEFVGFEAFAEHAGAPEPLEVAIELATRLRRRVVFSPASAEDFLWTLVAADGHVVLNDDKLDEGEISVLGVARPIPGAPDLPRLVTGTDRQRQQRPQVQ